MSPCVLALLHCHADKIATTTVDTAISEQETKKENAITIYMLEPTRSGAFGSNVSNVVRMESSSESESLDIIERCLGGALCCSYGNYHGTEHS